MANQARWTRLDEAIAEMVRAMGQMQDPEYRRRREAQMQEEARVRTERLLARMRAVAPKAMGRVVTIRVNKNTTVTGRVVKVEPEVEQRGLSLIGIWVVRLMGMDGKTPWGPYRVTRLPFHKEG